MSQDLSAQNATVGFLFNQAPSQEYLSTLKQEYKDDGWSEHETDEHCMWINAERSYSHTINKQNGQWMYIDEKWIRNLKMSGYYDQ